MVIIEIFERRATPRTRPPDQDRYIMTLFTRVLWPDAPCMCHPSPAGNRDARADAGRRAAMQVSQPCAQPPHPPPRRLIRMRHCLAPSASDLQCRSRHPSQSHFPYSALHHRANLARGFLLSASRKPATPERPAPSLLRQASEKPQHNISCHSTIFKKRFNNMCSTNGPRVIQRKDQESWSIS